MTADDAGTVPGAGSGPTPAVPAPDQRPARRRRFRAWRRSRPFWGGLLLLLSGLELIFIPLSGVLFHGAIKLVIYIGIGGVFGVVIGALLIAAGLVTWFNPAHRTFYGIAGIVLGLASFPASNLGGFLLGMLLALLGGSLAFAWTPLQQAPSATETLVDEIRPPDDASAQAVPLADLLTGDDEGQAGEARSAEVEADAADADEAGSQQDSQPADAESPVGESEAALS